MIEEILKKYRRFVLQYYNTQQDAANDLNISRTHLNKILNKKYYPSTTLLVKIEEIMKKYGYEE